MKQFTFLLALIVLLTSCKKDTTIYPFQQNVSGSLERQWKLQTYIIRCNNADFLYFDKDIAKHALLTLQFAKAGSYQAQDNNWSGEYKFSHDSTVLSLTPTDIFKQPFTLSIDFINNKILRLSTQVVQINPLKPTSTQYDLFVAYQGCSWLAGHNIDYTQFTSIQIVFYYNAL